MTEKRENPIDDSLRTSITVVLAELGFCRYDGREGRGVAEVGEGEKGEGGGEGEKLSVGGRESKEKGKGGRDASQ